MKLHALESHTGSIYQVEWSPQSETHVASCGADRRVMIWDLSQIGVEQTAEVLFLLKISSVVESCVACRTRKMVLQNCCSFMAVTLTKFQTSLGIRSTRGSWLLWQIITLYKFGR